VNSLAANPVQCVFRFGTAEFDEARHELRVAGLAVEIETRALKLLAYMLRHAGEVVSKDELLSEVWSDRVTMEKVIPNAMTKLRGALGESNSEHIVTVYRVGYRIDGVERQPITPKTPITALDLAAGHALSKRPNFVLTRQLSACNGIEVWLAEHQKTRQNRVYKLCNDINSRRSLKREATLSRVLQECLEDRPHFVDIIDWNFESAPYFLESHYAGINLADWAKLELEGLCTEARLALFLQVADAVAAAHSIGVIHKDLKPSNILIEANSKSNGAWHARISDFGSGRLMDAEQLAKLQITELGAHTQNMALDSSSGTPMYIAPEVFAGQVPGVQNDVYALGVLLYQLLSGQLNKPMSTGWEVEIDSEFLQEDLRRATDGNPERRFASVTEFAAQLRAIAIRSEQAKRASEDAEMSKRARMAFERSRARQPFLHALIASLGLIAVITGWLNFRANNARDQAQLALSRSNAVVEFVTGALFSRNNPAIMANGSEASLKDAVMGARSQISTRFSEHPLTEAVIRKSMAEMFNSIDLWPESVAEAEAALMLYQQHQGQPQLDAIALRAAKSRVLSLMGNFAQAEQELSRLLQQMPELDAYEQNLARCYIASARGTYYFFRGDYQRALPEIELSLATLPHEKKFEELRFVLKLDQAFALTMLKQPLSAQEIGEELLRELSLRPGDQSLAIAHTKTTLVRSYVDQRDFVTAERLIAESKSVLEQRLGKDHLRFIGLLAQERTLYLSLRNWPKALHAAEQVAQLISTRFGSMHLNTAIAHANWAYIAFEANAPLEEVQPRMRDAYQLVRELSGAADADTQRIALLSALIELETNQTDAAFHLLQSLNSNGWAVFDQLFWTGASDGLQGLIAHKKGGSRDAIANIRAAIKRANSTDRDLRFYRMLERALVEG
jgi:eukaryotic-like serine/threonine-protein kinase